MKKLFIKNRDAIKLAVVVEENSAPKGLAFVMHGQGGFKEQPHIRTFIEAFKESGYTVVSFDTANTIGESGGKPEKATITSYYADLEDVIQWASRQSWYDEPFVLVGHSLGGICAALYAEEHPDKVKALAPISTVVSGQLSMEASQGEKLETWKKTGLLKKDSNSKPGVTYILPWSNMEDRLKYDLLPAAAKLIMPVLLMAGDQDDSTPYEHQEILFKEIPEPKEIHLIKGAEHTFRKAENLKEIKEIFLQWIQKI
jgi:alpha-beta hydrolase superfamily lysophospholipase